MGSVSVVLVRPLVAALPPAALAAFYGATDLTPEIVADVDARITAPQFCIAWAEAARLAQRPALALDLAAAIPIGAFGIVEYLCRAAPTLGEALRRWVRYLNLLDDAVAVALEVDADRAHLRVARESEAPAPASHELCWALVARYARELAQRPFRLAGVDFAHAAPADPAPYRAFFDAPVAFGAGQTRLSFPRAALESPLASADPALLAILERAATTIEVPREPPLVVQVKRALHEALRTDDAQIEAIAKRLGLAPRSLQRRLKDDGASFAALREDVRRDLAQRYLHDGHSIAEISFLLGFSEPSAFFRAFKRWTGITPLEARARLATT